MLPPSFHDVFACPSPHARGLSSHLAFFFPLAAHRLQMPGVRMVCSLSPPGTVCCPLPTLIPEECFRTVNTRQVGVESTNRALVKRWEDGQPSGLQQGVKLCPHNTWPVLGAAGRWKALSVAANSHDSEPNFRKFPSKPLMSAGGAHFDSVLVVSANASSSFTLLPEISVHHRAPLRHLKGHKTEPCPPVRRMMKSFAP